MAYLRSHNKSGDGEPLEERLLQGVLRAASLAAALGLSLEPPGEPGTHSLYPQATFERRWSPLGVLNTGLGPEDLG